MALERLVRRRKSAQAMAMRARIVLACAEGATNRAVAAQLGVSEAMVGKWRRRFVAKRLHGLFDERRPGAVRTITDDELEAVIVKTLEEKLKDATHWSTRSMAKATGMSQTAISRIWRAFGLQPWRAESFKLSTDPLFVDKVKDIVGLYLDPPERAAVLCVDEKSQIQALIRAASQLRRNGPKREALLETVGDGQPFLLGQEPSIDRRWRPEQGRVEHLLPVARHQPAPQPAPLTCLPGHTDDPTGRRVVHSL